MPEIRYMQYNGRCGCHFMKPERTFDDSSTDATIKLESDSVDLPAAGKVTFYVSKNRRGLRKDFDYDGTPVIFNNPYRQTLDESGKPLLKSIFSGAFQSTDKPKFPTDEIAFDVLRERKEGKRTNIPRPNNVDNTKNCPLIQSTLTGAYYGEAHNSRNTLVQKPNLMEKYRRSVSDYSNVVKTIKPAKSQQFGHFRYSGHGPHKGPDLEIPKTEGEVITFYNGRPTTQTAAVMAQYLANCSKKEKNRFARSVGTSNNASPIRDQPECGQERSLSQNSFPIERNQEPGPASPDGDVSAASPSSKLNHQQAIMQAKKLVQSRALPGPIRPASVADLPSSLAGASSPIMDGVAPPSLSPARLAPRRADNMHKDLQASAFGATFATSGLGSLERILRR